MSALIESDSEVFHQILGEALTALDRSKVNYVLIGGVAATALGGHRFTHDIDVFVRPIEADHVLKALEESGFKTEKTDPHWLYKAFKDNVMVDIIFRSAGLVYLDDEMFRRSKVVEFNGRVVRALAPEDLFVVKALVLNEHSLSLDEHCMRHLNDLLELVRTCAFDWDYLIKRARLGPRRVLSLLLYAQSLDLLVPNSAVRALADLLEI
jgi:predicted nucleotidyltransferase